jgi:sulfonate transport system substrate-binding protein
VLDVRQGFAERYPAYVERVLGAYEWAHARALAAPDELRAALAREAHLSDAVAARVLARTDLSSTAIGETQRNAIALAGAVLEKSRVIPAGTDVEATTHALIDPSFSAKLSH